MDSLRWTTVGIAAAIVVAIGGALAFILSPGTPPKPNRYDGQVQSTALLRVPVTGIYPGGNTAGLNPNMANPLANDPDANLDLTGFHWTDANGENISLFSPTANSGAAIVADNEAALGFGPGSTSIIGSIDWNSITNACCDMCVARNPCHGVHRFAPR